MSKIPDVVCLTMRSSDCKRQSIWLLNPKTSALFYKKTICSKNDSTLNAFSGTAGVTITNGILNFEITWVYNTVIKMNRNFTLNQFICKYSLRFIITRNLLSDILRNTEPNYSFRYLMPMKYTLLFDLNSYIFLCK
jgi:hypothetical protein